MRQSLALSACLLVATSLFHAQAGAAAPSAPAAAPAKPAAPQRAAQATQPEPRAQRPAGARDRYQLTSATPLAVSL